MVELGTEVMQSHGDMLPVEFVEVVLVVSVIELGSSQLKDQHKHLKV